MDLNNMSLLEQNINDAILWASFESPALYFFVCFRNTLSSSAGKHASFAQAAQAQAEAAVAAAAAVAALG